MLALFASQGVGQADVGAPACVVDCFVTDPILTSSVTFYFTFSKGPIVGFTILKPTLVNCTLSSFVQVGNNVYSVLVSPGIDGTFSVTVPANCCTFNNVNNTVSNTLTKTYASGASYDLQHAALIAKASHFRGHVASFSDVTDTNFVSGEMFCTRENIRATIFDPSTTQTKKDVFTFGACDFGEYLHVTDASGGDFATIDPQITTNRNGDDATCLSYGSGITTYSAQMIPRLLGGRNSDAEDDGHQESRYAPGLTDSDFISRASTIRMEHYSKSSAGNFYSGTWAQGLAKLDTIIPAVIAASEWYVNFNHWYKTLEDYLPNYFKYITAKLAGQNAYYGPYGTVLEYYWVREAIDSVTGTGGTITINYTKKYPGSPYSRISTPAWIKLDLTGTVFAGQTIVTNVAGGKVRSMGSNVYYVSCPLDFTTTSVSFNVGITTSPSYVNLNTPVISLSGSTVTSDQLIKLALWTLALSNTGTSTSSITLPSSNPSTISGTTQVGLSLAQGYVIKLYHDSTHYISGVILTYDSVTGNFTMTGYDFVGSGSFSSWTLYTAQYEINLILAEKQLTSNTSFTLATAISLTTKMYWVGGVTGDGMSAVRQF